jgi:hypothetical protein
VGFSTAALSCTACPATCAGLASCITSICCLYICILQMQGVCADRFGHRVLLLVLKQGLFPSWSNIHLRHCAVKWCWGVLGTAAVPAGQAHQQGCMAVIQHSWGARVIHNVHEGVSDAKVKLSSWSVALCRFADDSCWFQAGPVVLKAGAHAAAVMELNSVITGPGSLQIVHSCLFNCITLSVSLTQSLLEQTGSMCLSCSRNSDATL